jgi:AhpD family alkylhydroperoxidase
MTNDLASNARKEWADLEELSPGLEDAIATISAIVKASNLDRQLLELVKIRASQINGCAYCLQLHLNTARKLGMQPAKVDLVAVWPEAGIFSEQEMAALAWTELVTDVAHGGVPDEAYDAIHAHFSESEVAVLTAAIVEINAWNRLGAIYRMTPPIP